MIFGVSQPKCLKKQIGQLPSLLILLIFSSAWIHSVTGTTLEAVCTSFSEFQAECHAKTAFHCFRFSRKYEKLRNISSEKPAERILCLGQSSDEIRITLIKDGKEIRETDRGSFSSAACTSLKNAFSRIVCDQRNFYCAENIFSFSAALGGHALISNTSLDRNFRDWYQDDVRSSGTDDVSRFFKVFGEGSLFIPTFCIASAVYRIGQESRWFRRPETVWGEFVSRSARSYIVGTPTILLGQYALGCSRPNDFQSHHSAWRPFQDNNSISGHAFIGATPFLAAAQMTDRFWLKAALVTGSFLPGISRINDDAHYSSQVLLGWYLAYLSVRTVAITDGRETNRNYLLFPIIASDNIGAGIVFRR
ncbi:MAG: phosphatase PAP2 family protein [Planctomycetaceae bacterium]|jgi:membrane-associated phospholipid phosphatase|nr:phosphatase PAP2 family protein [Planctomycetaceae bacterium]